MASLTRSVLMRKFKPGRCFHTSQIRLIDPKTVEEVKIPVPWGHVAGKWWGNKNVQPLLALHGWLDNAGSWDPMAELMPDDFAMLAIDLPGNGKSSHLLPFQNYYFKDTTALMRKIKKYFGWGKLDLIGHSGGANIAFTYATIFPEDVRSLFCIDYLTYCYNDEKKVAIQIGGLIDKKILLSLRDHYSSTRYSWNEAKESWIDATKPSLSEKSAEILMHRGTEKISDGKYIFSRDQRLKGEDIYLFSTEEVYSLSNNISCHVRLVRGTTSQFFVDKGIKNCPNILNIIEAKAKSYKLYDIDGNHHLHMDVPEKIVPLLVEMLNQKL